MSTPTEQAPIFEASEAMVTASQAITEATGIEFEPDAATALDATATICADYPVVWAALRSLIDATHAGEVSADKEVSH